jgi:acyl carrier protein
VSSDIDRLREYIRTEMDYPDHIEADVDLLKGDILDSFSIVQLAVWIEETFDLELEAEDLVRDNLYSLDSMLNMINNKRVSAN